MKYFYVLPFLLWTSFIIAQESAKQEIDPQLATVFQTTLYQQRDALDAIGLSVAVSLPGGAVWSGATGINSVANDSLNVNQLMGIGSVTKTLTAACIMKLQEEGLLDIDDAISNYLPPYTNVNPDITIRQLLNHTSGVYNYSNNAALAVDLFMNPQTVWTAEEIIQQYVLSPVFEPGTSWEYSNTNYLLLGLIIESVTSQSYNIAIRERFFTPLGLSTFYLFPQEDIPLDVSHLWIDLYNNDNPVDIDAQGISRNALFSTAFSSGALLATPSEVATWLHQLFEGNVLSSESLAAMQDWIETGDNKYYGLGLEMRSYGGKQIIGHVGSIGYRTEAYYSPDDHISIAVHTNDGTQDVLTGTVLAFWHAYTDYAAVQENQAHDLRGVQVSSQVFDDDISLSFTLRHSVPVHIDILDLNGRKCFSNDEVKYTAGSHSVRLSHLPMDAPGMYFLRFTAGNENRILKLVHR